MSFLIYKNKLKRVLFQRKTEGSVKEKGKIEKKRIFVTGLRRAKFLYEKCIY